MSIGLAAPVDARSTRQALRWTTVLDGRQLRELRRRRCLSQEQLADRAGVSLATVGRLERQIHAPCRCRTLGRLAVALGEHPANLMPPGR
jgi:transcriptional regulator with XRE-family HTH domain